MEVFRSETGWVEFLCPFKDTPENHGFHGEQSDLLLFPQAEFHMNEEGIVVIVKEIHGHQASVHLDAAFRAPINEGTTVGYLAGLPGKAADEAGFPAALAARNSSPTLLETRFFTSSTLLDRLPKFIAD